MATRANVAILLNDEDSKSVLNFFDKRFDEVRPEINPLHWGYTYEKVNIKENICDIKCKDGHKYLQIYVHNDGYPDGVGYTLTKYYDTYEKVLALILAGDTSAVHEDSTVAYVGRNEPYATRVRPKSCEKPVCNEDYLYVFGEDGWEAYSYSWGTRETYSINI